LHPVFLTGQYTKDSWFKANVTINDRTSAGWIHQSLINLPFNSNEEKIIKYGLENGKNADEVEQAIIKLRSGDIPPKTDAVTQSTTTDINAEVNKTVKGNWFTRLFSWFR
jgi:hypothetical protein